MNFIKRKENNMYNNKVTIVLDSRSKSKPKTICLDDGSYFISGRNYENNVLGIAIPYYKREYIDECLNKIHSCENVSIIEKVKNEEWFICYIQGDIVIVYK